MAQFYPKAKLTLCSFELLQSEPPTCPSALKGPWLMCHWASCHRRRRRFLLNICSKPGKYLTGKRPRLPAAACHQTGAWHIYRIAATVVPSVSGPERGLCERRTSDSRCSASVFALKLGRRPLWCRRDSNRVNTTSCHQTDIRPFVIHTITLSPNVSECLIFIVSYLCL